MLIKYVDKLFIFLALSGCGRHLQLPVLPVAPDTKEESKPEEKKTDNTVSITYFSLTRTEAPVNGWSTKTYTATGFCLVYDQKTYCWDDGMKTLQWVFNNFSYGPFTYSYFNMNLRSDGTFGHSGGGMYSDLMPVPRFISTTLSNNMGSGDVNTVLSTGAALTVTCTPSGGVVTCPDFSLDTNQLPL